MPVDFQSRTKYLTLALFAQDVQEELESCIRGQKQSSESSILRDAEASLKSLLTDARPGNHALVPPFENYDQLRTLQEAWTQDNRADALRLIETLLHPAENEAGTPRDIAVALISLFEHLELRALWNFDQGERVIPQGIRQLCQPA
jgi:hypothetical protein